MRATARAPAAVRDRLFSRLVRELVHVETRARDHVPRLGRRLGETPPVLALRDVALHAAAMTPRLAHALHPHPVARTRLGTLRDGLRDLLGRARDGERAYRAVLVELRHGLDVVRVLREVADHDERFAVIRWCDDWLATRRTLVARVEAQLAWVARLPARSSPGGGGPGTVARRWHADRIAIGQAHQERTHE
jgi:hypothetical protein